MCKANILYNKFIANKYVCIVAFGMLLSAGSVFVGGVLEIYRKKNLEETGGIIQDLSGDKYNASTLTMFLQVPQFALVGASEVFTSISGMKKNKI
jgi:peptide/histidine transporter 3/4